MHLLRRTLLWLYWSWLTFELLLSNPWEFFGRTLADNPPFDTSAAFSSLLLHTGAYGVLALLIEFAYQPKRRQRRYWFWAVVVHGLCSELLQYFVPNRWPSFIDIFSNLSGLLLGVFLWRGLKKSERLPDILNWISFRLSKMASRASGSV